MDKIKFGVFLPFYAYQNKNNSPSQQYKIIQDIALESEKLGYHSIWLDDHLMYNECPIFESWTVLSALSNLTSKIRLGTMVTCNQHHNPGLLAKTAATLDVLSNGRLEFGIGAGIQKQEHIAYGFGFPELSTRTERLAEALSVMTALWTKEKASYNGKHYTIKDAVCAPKPIQKPYPPITVGGVGEKMLEVTAKYADRFDWGFLPSKNMYSDKLLSLKKKCTKVGRDYAKIEKSCWPAGQLLLAQNQIELNKKISIFKPEGVTIEDFKKYTLTATPETCMEELQVYLNLGVSYFMLFFADLPSMDSLRQFSRVMIN